MTSLEKRSYLTSFILHYILLVVLITSSSGENGTKSEYNSVLEVQIIDKPQNESSSISMIMSDNGVDKKSKKNTHDCENWFGGIGVEHTFIDHEIVIVWEGYPAHRAGIKVGDHITGGVSHIKGKPGTMVTIYILRNGITMRFDLIRDKICIAPPKN